MSGLGGFESPSRPGVSLICYLCGQGFGSASIDIHQKQCAQKWLLSWQVLPKHLQKTKIPPPPEVPRPISLRDEEAVAAFNDAAMVDFQRNSLAECPYCSRSFWPEKLIVHFRSCKSVPSGEDPMASPSSPSRGPKTFACYICGREFGSASLEIHQKQCIQKFELEQSRLPSNLRRSIADLKLSAPSSAELQSMSEAEREAFNTSASGSFTESLVPCEQCGRTFLPDRLVVHMRSCRGESSRPAATSNLSRIPRPGASTASSIPKQGSSAPASSSSSLSASSSSGFPTSKLARPTASGPPAHPAAPAAAPVSKMSAPSSSTVGLKKPGASLSASSSSLPSSSSSSHSSTPSAVKPGPAGGRPSVGGPAARPRLLMCYICGREFGSASLDIHMKQCREKFEIEQSKLPPNMRRKLPTPPAAVQDAAAAQTDLAAREAYNNAADKMFSDSLVPCQNCGRRFLPDRLQVHMRSCKTASPAKLAPARESSASTLTAPSPTAPVVKKRSPSVSSSSSSDGYVDRSSDPRRLNVGLSKTAGGLSQSGHSGPSSSASTLGRPAGHSAQPSLPRSASNSSTMPASSSLSASSSSASSHGSSATNRLDGTHHAGPAARVPAPRHPPAMRSTEPPPIVSSSGSSSSFGGNPYAGGGDGMDVDPSFEPPSNLVPCNNCGRRFAEDRIEKHETACMKMKDRKPFNSAKARVVDEEMAKLQKQKPAQPPPAQKAAKSKKYDWKMESERFRATLRVARGDNSGPVIPEPEDDRVQCPHCGRKYNETVAERHIPKCKDIINKPKALPTKPGAVVRPGMSGASSSSRIRR